MVKRILVFLLLLLPALLFADQAEYGIPISDRLHIGGEAGFGYFDTEEFGEFPDNEFLVDEARLFIEAKIIEKVYAFAEINLVTRENFGSDIELGELYVEFEDIGNKSGLFNARVGRFDIPFGEEYLTRDAIDNPLISHSLSDIWGVDEGVQIFGAYKQLEYAFAVQNGGEPVANDFNPDKAVVGRILLRPASAFHVSFSAMRTGDLDIQEDQFSEVWFGNGFLVPLGSIPDTETMEGDLIQGDAHMKWTGGHIHFAGGQLRYDDDDSTADNSREAPYFSIEAVQNLNKSQTHPWYAAARFSRVTSDRGFPIVGFGDFDAYLFESYRLTKELWRLSLGVGYRVGKHLLFKAEYSFEDGEQLDGTKRDQENFFGMEVAVGF